MGLDRVAALAGAEGEAAGLALFADVEGEAEVERAVLVLAPDVEHRLMAGLREAVGFNAMQFVERVQQLPIDLFNRGKGGIGFDQVVEPLAVELRQGAFEVARKLEPDELSLQLKQLFEGRGLFLRALRLEMRLQRVVCVLGRVVLNLGIPAGVGQLVRALLDPAAHIELRAGHALVQVDSVAVLELPVHGLNQGPLHVSE